MTLSGVLRFGRYAFPPNRLGYCGPPDHGALLEYVASGEPDRGLLELARRFEGAYPYLVLIAHANGIGDPFDDRVVAAYWLGNSLLERVGPAQLSEALTERFKPVMARSDFAWLGSKLDLGARPHHNFHVFDIYVRAGLMRDQRAEIALVAMDSCRISWATVASVCGDELVVERCPLVLADGKLALGSPQTKTVTWRAGGRGLFEQVQPGDDVSIHWDWACETLAPKDLDALRAQTSRYIALANTTI